MADPGRAACNLAWADALVAGLRAGGLRHAVVSPGSRSTPLALAFDRCPDIDTTVLPDERCAAFFALGLARHAGTPAAVVCTSGSALANWFPAVLEASADGVGLILLSADRPVELQRTGANQVTDQNRLFGQQVRDFVTLPAPDSDTPVELAHRTGLRASERARWPLPGPVHVNLAFREPLVPATLPPFPAATARVPGGRPRVAPDPAVVVELAAIVASRPGLFVCGRGVGEPGFAATIAALAEGLGAPIIADPLAGLRWGPHDRRQVLTAYDLFLRNARFAATHAPDWVVQFGAAPVSAVFTGFLERCGARLFLSSTHGDWPDPARRAESRILGEPLGLAEALIAQAPAAAPAGWSSDWREADSRAADLARTAELRPVEADVVTRLEATLEPDALLFVGNSIPIRALDAFARGRAQPLAVHGNRGLSGIDGNLSTALGLGCAARAPVSALIGDLTLYHDMNGLLGARDVSADFVVLDNGGGGIFGLLPQQRLSAFERLWLTPTGLDLRRVAELYGLDYLRVDAGSDLPLPRESDAGSRLIHVPVDRELSEDRFTRLWEAASKDRGDV